MRKPGSISLGRFACVVTVSSVLAVTACVVLAIAAYIVIGSATAPPEDGRMPVVVSTAPHAYIVHRLNEGMYVQHLLPLGASPTTFTLSERKLDRIRDAALYAEVGAPYLGYEKAAASVLRWPWQEFERVSSVVGESGAKDQRPLADPSAWLLPREVRGLSERITAALDELQPHGVSRHRAHLESFKTEIDEVDTTIRQLLEKGEGSRFLVHGQAWTAFAEEYGLEILTVTGPGKEPDSTAMKEFAETVRTAGIEVLFAGPHDEPRAVQAAAAELGVRVEILDPLTPEWAANLKEVAGSIGAALR